MLHNGAATKSTDKLSTASAHLHLSAELVNGRLAMLGFAAALSAELVSHVSVFEQFKQAAGPIFVVGAIIALASIVPIVRGTDQLDDGAGEGIPGQGGIRCDVVMLTCDTDMDAREQVHNRMLH